MPIEMLPHFLKAGAPINTLMRVHSTTGDAPLHYMVLKLHQGILISLHFTYDDILIDDGTMVQTFFAMDNTLRIAMGPDMIQDLHLTQRGINLNYRGYSLPEEQVVALPMSYIMPILVEASYGAWLDQIISNNDIISPATLDMSSHPRTQPTFETQNPLFKTALMGHLNHNRACEKRIRGRWELHQTKSVVNKMKMGELAEKWGDTLADGVLKRLDRYRRSS